MQEDWSDMELAAAVDAYNEMARLEAARKPYNKRQVYRDLAAQHGRTEKSFEYRMQNISAVLNELGRPWVPGLKPAGNVGANVKPRIVALLSRPVRRPRNLKPAEEPAYKAKLPYMREWLINVARSQGKVTYGDVMQAFGIDRYSLRFALGYLGHQADNRDEPILTALVVSKTTGLCSIGLKREFGIEDDEAERQRLYEFWQRTNEPPAEQPPNASLEVRAARFVSVEARPDQAAFRERVFMHYAGTCAISGCRITDALDAAHKSGRDWRKGHNRAEDGYVLRKDLHALYDAGLLRVAEGGLVELDEDVAKHYEEFVGKMIASGPCGGD
jgi:hypothetical protein